MLPHAVSDLCSGLKCRRRRSPVCWEVFSNRRAERREHSWGVGRPGPPLLSAEGKSLAYWFHMLVWNGVT